MKHSKNKNVGVLFEILNHAVMRESSNGNVSTARDVFSILKNNFVNKTEISKAYKIYSQFIYSEARNSYFASKFLENLKKEYSSTINEKKLNAELSQLMEDISKIINKKELLKTPIPNYKELASFYIKLHEGDQYISSREILSIEQTLFEHLIDNKEAKRVRSQRNKFENVNYLSAEEIQTSKLSLILSVQKFDEAYGSLLTKEQKDYLVKYYTSSTDRELKKWIDKKVKGLLDEVADKSLKIEDKKIQEKIQLVIKKLEGTLLEGTVTTDSLRDIILSIELKDKLKLF